MALTGGVKDAGGLNRLMQHLNISMDWRLHHESRPLVYTRI